MIELRESISIYKYEKLRDQERGVTAECLTGQVPP